MTAYILSALMCVLCLTACSTNRNNTATPKPVLINPDIATTSGVSTPKLPWARTPAAPPPPSRFPRSENFSVNVKKVSALSVLQALSTSEGFSYEGDECAEQPINLFLKNASLDQAIERIADIANLQYRWEDNHLKLSCNKPYWVTYTLDYPALERNTQENISIQTQVGGTSGGLNGINPGTGGLAGGFNNEPNLSVKTVHQNAFWTQLSRAIETMLTEPESKDLTPIVTTETTVTQQNEGTTLNTDSQGRVRQRDIRSSNLMAPFNNESTINRKTSSSSTQPLTRVLTHTESGIVMVRATQKQHEQVAELIETVTQRALKQVLIEATVAEVRLSHQYQKGIQWQALTKGGNGLGFDQSLLKEIDSTQSQNSGLFTLRFKQNALAGVLGINAALSLLEEFGDVRVISNPKLAVLNQQTAVMKVVDNRVYFTVQVQTSAPTNTSGAYSTFSTQVHTVPVGFFMSVIPHIEDESGVSLMVRPTVSRIVGFINDPNPALANAGITSRIPEIQTREIESVLRLQNGEIALLGGLIQTSNNQINSGIPGMQTNEIVNQLFGQTRQEDQRTELVILLQPVIQPISKSRFAKLN